MKVKQVKKPRRRSPPQHSTYLYHKIAWLYLHSLRFRLTFLYIILAAKDLHRLYLTLTSYRQHLVAAYRDSVVIRAVAMFILLAAGSVVLQLAYPSDRTLPLSRLENKGFVGFKSQAEIADKLDALDRQTITVTTGGNNIETTPLQMGVELDKTTTFERLSHYPESKRWIPFSIVASSARSQSVVRSVDEKKLDNFVSKLITKTYAKPRDASIERRRTALIVRPAVDGYQYHAEDIKKQLAGVRFGSYDPIDIQPEILLPAISTATADGKVELMQRRIDTPLTIWVGDKNMTITSSDITSWIDIVAVPGQQTIELSFNKSRVAEKLKAFAGTLDMAAKPTVDTLLNGTLAGSVNGQSGQSLRFDELVQRVAASTHWSVRSITAEVEPILPKQTVVRRYTRDSQGIQSLLNQWALDHGGQQMAYMRTLNGRLEAGINPYQSISGRGINRLYIAHLIYGRLAANSLRADSLTSTGLSVDGCLEQMLVNRHEGCLYALGNIVGWEYGNNTLLAQGFEGTNLAYSSSSTSLSDSAQWLIKIQGSSIVNVPQTNAIISMMSRHSMRSGIPTGAPGMQVANSVSTENGNWQEAGLVFHPRSAYVLSVFVRGGQANIVAELAAEINRVLSE